MSDAFTDELVDLVRSHFHSISEIEALILLVEDRRRWTVDEVSAELSLAPDHVRLLFRLLIDEGLIGVDGDQYWFPSPDLTFVATIEQFARLYPTYRLRVSNIVFGESGKQVHDFAAAFRIRRHDRGSGGS